MKNFLIVFCLCYMLMACCIPIKQTIIHSEDIIGSWQLTENQVNYTELTFNKDSTAIFKSRGDTIFRFNYWLKSDTLMLLDLFHKQSKHKLLKLNKDSLIFQSFFENTGEQIYIRTISSQK